MKITTRLKIQSGLLIGMLLVMSIFAWASTKKAHHEEEELIEILTKMEEGVNSARYAQVMFKTQIQEWKNVLLRGEDPEQYRKYKAAFIDKGDIVQKELSILKGTLSSIGASTPLIDQAAGSLRNLDTQYLDSLAQYERGEIEALQSIDTLVKGMDRAPTSQIDEIVDWVVQQSKSRKAEAEIQLQQDFRNTIIVLSILVLAGAVIGLVVTWRVVMGISRPLSEAVLVAQTVASRDLTTRIGATSTDETGQVMQALKEMNQNLGQTISSVRDGADSIAASASEVAEANQNLATRTMEQASSLDQTTATMEELTSTVRQNADNANHARSLAAEASSITLEGGKVVTDVVTTMSSINDSSSKMIDIIGVIDGIAFQTNILALNAAVEAARAGEQGRGFAVVADEVRNLAHKSASAARDIRELIDSSVQKIEEGSSLAQKAGTTMDSVVHSIKKVNDIVEEISLASNEQRSAIEGVNEMILRMNEMTQENAAMVEEAAAATQSMQTEASNLTEEVRAFQLPSGTRKPDSVSRSTRRRVHAKLPQGDRMEFALPA